VTTEHRQGFLYPRKLCLLAMRVENAAREFGVADAGLLNGEIHGGLQWHRRWHTHHSLATLGTRGAAPDRKLTRGTRAAGREVPATTCRSWPSFHPR
jgi:hypothetical protein